MSSEVNPAQFSLSTNSKITQIEVLVLARKDTTHCLSSYSLSTGRHGGLGINDGRQIQDVV
jgi:hypothetical protein